MCTTGSEPPLLLLCLLWQGGDLRTALSGNAGHELQWYKQGKSIMLDVLKGTHFLHACQPAVIHRDIKSAVSDGARCAAPCCAAPCRASLSGGVPSCAMCPATAFKCAPWITCHDVLMCGRLPWLCLGVIQRKRWDQRPFLQLALSFPGAAWQNHMS
jgi:hypothetical protein